MPGWKVVAGRQRPLEYTSKLSRTNVKNWCTANMNIQDLVTSGTHSCDNESEQGVCIIILQMNNVLLVLDVDAFRN